jgi:futalosine hydrolase
VARVLAVTAVPAERDAALAALDSRPDRQLLSYELHRAVTGDVELTCVAAGVGPAAAAACAASVLALDGGYDTVVSTGVAGGFAGRAEPATLVLADRVVLADLGADSPSGFLPLDELGLGGTTVHLPGATVERAAAGLAAVAPVAVGPVLTVSTATGTDERAGLLAARHDPVAEAMEGGGVLAAATAHGLPFLELRAVSNTVGRRDRSAWVLPEALALLGKAVATLLPVIA